MKVKAIFLFAFFIIGSLSMKSQNSNHLKNLQDSAAYSIGISIGSKMISDNLIRVDLDYLEMGITTAIKQDNAWISPEQSQSVIQRVKSNINYSKQSGDSAAYAIGLSIGTNMNKDGISNLNLTILMNGVKETFSKRPQVSEKVATAVITNYLTMVKIEKGNENYSAGKEFLKQNLRNPGVHELSTGLQFVILKEGNGSLPSLSDTVVVHYHGTLLNGKVFDSSIERGQAAEFPVGAVIEGWTQALQMMRVGSKWRLFIPPALAYGDRSAGPLIGPYSTLIFDVELISIKNHYFSQEITHTSISNVHNSKVDKYDPTSPAKAFSVKFSDDGVKEIPIKINNLSPINFIIDTGADETTLTSDILSVLIRQKIVTEEDFLEGREYRLADGSTVKSPRFIIRKMEIGDFVLRDITASISSAKATPLLGQNVLSKFQSIRQDNVNQEVVFEIK